MAIEVAVGSLFGGRNAAGNTRPSGLICLELNTNRENGPVGGNVVMRRFRKESYGEHLLTLRRFGRYAQFGQNRRTKQRKRPFHYRRQKRQVASFYSDANSALCFHPLPVQHLEQFGRMEPTGSSAWMQKLMRKREQPLPHHRPSLVNLPRPRPRRFVLARGKGALLWFPILSAKNRCELKCRQEEAGRRKDLPPL